MTNKARAVRGLTSKRWRVKTEHTETENNKILETKENAFLRDVYTQLTGYEDKLSFNATLSELIRRHAIDVVSEKLYDRHGCRFLDLLISDDDNEFYNLEICFG